jgi:Domain of unknown function (DUF1824)
MTVNPSTNLTIDEALKILKEYSCMQIKIVESATEKEQLKEALLLITGLSEYENLGICADNIQEGLMALSSYLKAFNYKVKDKLVANSEIEGAVYIKFNTQKMAHYYDTYTGSYRGVLVSCQSENDALVGTYGHFPLDLFSNV